MSEHKPKRSDISDDEMLDAVRRFRRHEADTPDVALAHKYPVKVIMAKMEQLERCGWLNFGVSLRTAWVEEDVVAKARAGR